MPSRVPQLKSIVKTRKRDESKAERDAFYSSAAWMRLRLSFLEANPICQSCLDRDEINPATIAHHIAERLADPKRALDRSNLMAMCHACHTAHHNNKKTNQNGSFLSKQMTQGGA